MKHLILIYIGLTMSACSSLNTKTSNNTMIQTVNRLPANKVELMTYGENDLLISCNDSNFENRLKNNFQRPSLRQLQGI